LLFNGHSPDTSTLLVAHLESDSGCLGLSLYVYRDAGSLDLRVINGKLTQIVLVIQDTVKSKSQQRIVLSFYRMPEDELYDLILYSRKNVIASQLYTVRLGSSITSFQLNFFFSNVKKRLSAFLRFL